MRWKRHLNSTYLRAPQWNIHTNKNFQTLTKCHLSIQMNSTDRTCLSKSENTGENSARGEIPEDWSLRGSFEQGVLSWKKQWNFNKQKRQVLEYFREDIWWERAMLTQPRNGSEDSRKMEGTVERRPGPKETVNTQLSCLWSRWGPFSNAS